MKQSTLDYVWLFLVLFLKHLALSVELPVLATETNENINIR